MRTRLSFILVLALVCSMWITGCAKQEEAIISVETELPAEADEDLTGTIEVGPDQDELGGKSLNISDSVEGETEIVTVFSGEEEAERTFYRVRGNYGYSIAYDEEYLRFQPDELLDQLFSVDAETADTAQVRIYISENLEYALAELADQIVLGCAQECLVEELVIGEEEYPATWITYTEEAKGSVRQVDYYLIGFENRVMEIQVICDEAAIEEYYGLIQMVLSTLRLESIAEG